MEGDIKGQKPRQSAEVVSLDAWREKKRNAANVVHIAPLVEAELEAMQHGRMTAENVRVARKNFDAAYQTVSELLTVDAPNTAVLIKNIHLLSNNAEYIWSHADPIQTDILEKMSDLADILKTRFPDGLHGE